MRKYITILLIAIVSITSLFAGGDSESTTTSASSDGKVTIEVWTEDRHDLEYVRAKVDEYNSTNTDNIFINLTVISENFRNMLQLAYNGGTAPDVAGVNALPLDLFVDSGILAPLNSHIDNSPEYQRVNTPYEQAYEGRNAKNGNIYWIPTGIRSGVRVIYNKNLIEQCGYTGIPKTLDEYIDMAADITRQGNSRFYGIGFTNASPFERLLEMVAEMSGIYYYDYVNGRYDFSGYKPILEKGQRFFKENIAYPDQQGVDNMRALFTVGSFALWSNASQEVAVFTEQLPITQFEWGVAELPTLDGEVKGALSVTLSKGWGIISSTKHPEEAWKVIEFFQSEDFIKGYLEAGYCLPGTEFTDQLIDKSKTGRLADFSLTSYESVYPQVPAVNLSGDDYRTVMWNIVQGYIGIDEGLADLTKRYNDALEADIKAGSTKRLVIKDYDPLNPSAGTAEYLSE